MWWSEGRVEDAILTGGIHEGLVHSEGEQRLPEFAEEVLDDTTEHIDVFHSLQSRVALHTKETLLHLLDHLVRAVCRVRMVRGETVKLVHTNRIK